MLHEYEQETSNEPSPPGNKRPDGDRLTWVWIGCISLVIACLCIVGIVGVVGAFGLIDLSEYAGLDAPEIEVNTEPEAVTEAAATEVVSTPTIEATATKEPVVIPIDEWENVVIGPGEPIRIAVNTVTSGTGIKMFGLTEQRGAELAAVDFGQIAGHDVEIVPHDTECNAEGGRNAAIETVADETILAVVGHTCSVSCEAGATIYEDDHLTMVSPSCVAGGLTEGLVPPSFIRTGYNDNKQGRAAAEFAYYELGLTTVATIHDGSPYAEGVVEAFSEHFDSLGGTIVYAESVDVGETDMRPILKAIATSGPDMIYFPIFPAEASLIAIQSKEIQGLEDVVLMGSDVIKLDSFLDTAGDAAEGVYASGPTADSGSRYEDLLQAYEEAYGEEPQTIFAPESYDAMTLILKAIEAVALEDDQGNLVIGLKALRDAMYNTNFEGVTGTIVCTEFGDCGPHLTEIVQVVDGEFVVVQDGQ